MTTVNYVYTERHSHASGEPWPGMSILGLEPIPYLKWIKNEKGDRPYFPCPGFIDYTKNMYVVCATMDLELQIDFENKKMKFDGINSEGYFREFFVNRTTNEFLLFTLPPTLIFYSDKSVMIESLPLMLDDSELSKYVRIVPGTYNIGKWVRPIDFTIEVLTDVKTIKIKRGDPLFCVRFISENGSDIELVRQQYTKELEETWLKCINVKNITSIRSLKQLYEMAKFVLPNKKLKYGKSKCPFSFLRGK